MFDKASCASETVGWKLVRLARNLPKRPIDTAAVCVYYTMYAYTLAMVGRAHGEAAAEAAASLTRRRELAKAMGGGWAQHTVAVCS